ncbi:MAG: type II toxin-antitoxin system RelE/ParE family toxin [Syntrophobacteraceae bacterium]
MPGGYKIRWLRTALKNLDAEADYVAQDNPQAAAELVKRVFDSVDVLAKNPAIGRPGRVPDTRELAVTGTPYIVPYRVKGRTVDILRVFHGARRWPSGL